MEKVYKLKQKLNNRSGDTLVEVLMALLIVTLSVAMVTSVMLSSSRSLEKVEKIQSDSAEVLRKYWLTTVPSTTQTITISNDAFHLTGNLETYNVSGQTIYEITKIGD